MPTKARISKCWKLGLDEALEAVHDGRIIDAKTIMLLQHLKLEMLTGGYRGSSTDASKTSGWRGRHTAKHSG